MKSTWDRIGIFLSGLCVIHCLTLPFIFAFFPSLMNDVLEEKFHSYMLIFISLTALMAFVPTYLKHKKPKIFILPVVALTIIAIGTLFIHNSQNKILETFFSVVGSITLIYAHYKHILKHDHCCNDVHDHCDTELPDHGHSHEHEHEHTHDH